jgi:hypothetical protein
VAWPKGVKRVGYIKKDGTAHAKKGEGRRLTPRIETDKRPEPRVQVVRSPEPVLTVQKTAPAYKKTYTGQQKVTIAPCPDCGAPDAFTYCDNCGWYQYDPTCPHCKKGK